jgi:hypothetical protein
MKLITRVNIDDLPASATYRMLSILYSIDCLFYSNHKTLMITILPYYHIAYHIALHSCSDHVLNNCLFGHIMIMDNES